jgi:hypothetical protein
MKRDDATTPLGDLVSGDHTIERSSASQRTSTGLTPGTVIADRYRIVALLGRGGMGEVYRADDIRLGQPVALKFLSLGSGGAALENLYHEVRVARQVSHPNVCRVHDVVEAGGHRFIAMEYVDGEDLASLLRRIGRLPAQKATDVARDLAEGLAAAHDRGIVHRDLKPANVMIDGSGRAHVTDFGLASLAGSDDGRIAGTPAYMAPEQVAGQPVTTRSDVYSLGLVLHEMFTGERVYASASSFAERRQARVALPRPTSSSVKDVDPAVDVAIAACLAEDPAKRPATARAVLGLLPGGDALDAAMAAGETPSPEMVAAAAQTGEISRRVAGALVAATAIGLVLLSWQSQRFLFNLMRKPPEVLTERAAAIVARAGEPSPTVDETHTFAIDPGLLGSRWGRLPREQFAALRPGVVRFVYRRAATRMTPQELIQAGNEIFIFTSGRVTVTDPDFDLPGDAMVVLDQHGGLVRYQARPSTNAATTDWRPLLEATGVDLQTLRDSEPQTAPPVASDARKAWTAAFPGQRETVRIEAASLNGQPAWLSVQGPWFAQQHRTRSLTQLPWIVGVVQFLLTTTITIIAVRATLRSLRRGRGDRRGALRLALYIGACLFLSWLIAAHHTIDPQDEARLFSTGLYQAVGSAIGAWVFYMALEPGVRRTWPRLLIGWTRLLAGRIRDPLVAREILFGIAGAVLTHQAFGLVYWGKQVIGQGTAHAVRAATLQPLRVFIGDRLISHVMAILVAIGIVFFALIATRAMGRWLGIGIAVAFIVFYGTYAPEAAVMMLMAMLAVYYSGVLTSVALGATVFLLFSAPLTLDTRAWYWPRAAAMLLMVMALAVWAARNAAARSAPPHME